MAVSKKRWTWRNNNEKRKYVSNMLSNVWNINRTAIDQ
ncbi:hypothetical protein B4144_0466 [Bacillus atrophaeus]|nr:hypothetical protein B4144_0466 [Bacillus atrophaeus]